jgi:hypothetical protein
MLLSAEFNNRQAREELKVSHQGCGNGTGAVLVLLPAAAGRRMLLSAEPDNRRAREELKMSGRLLLWYG